MLTYQGLYTRFKKITSDDSSANETFGKALINETHKLICGSRQWWFTEKTFTSISTASQQEIKLPIDYRKLETFNITIGDVKYTPLELANPMAWDRVNAQGTNVTSDNPLYFIVRNGKIEVYPALSSAGSTITIEYLSMPVDMTAADYTTGTVDAVVSEATTITGDGTTWTTAMIGRYIKITSEGNWYKITARASNTSITIDKPYEGTTITSPGAEAYTIGELPLVIEAYQDLLWYRPVGVYYQMKGEENRARFYFSGSMRIPGLYETQMRDMIRELGSQTSQNVTPDRNKYPVNINDYPTDLT